MAAIYLRHPGAPLRMKEGSNNATNASNRVLRQSLLLKFFSCSTIGDSFKLLFPQHQVEYIPYRYAQILFTVIIPVDDTHEPISIEAQVINFPCIDE